MLVNGDRDTIAFFVHFFQEESFYIHRQINHQDDFDCIFELILGCYLNIQVHISVYSAFWLH